MYQKPISLRISKTSRRGNSINPKKIFTKNKNRYKFNVKSIKNQKKGEPQNQEGMSIEFRQPAINGRTDTVNDSVDFNSKNNINSLHNMNAKKNPNLPGQPQPKRESIYKAALLQHATILQVL